MDKYKKGTSNTLKYKEMSKIRVVISAPNLSYGIYK